ncbi:putative colanic acid biosynthesis acetyltransferase [Cerasicoccus arenae]|uniref:putative colanic acid biosynthesis acetyltransferase n=1 Tax=Cerasicoccus arenae TaxID=424488 RepID=UPI001677693B|nr:putative colanic acid biosynthesis acetyltransferase [Cerasicoccus arenae]MBK1858650.1 putative colanic acid biosynthesis acetyltransferase [Cerasicoccus arenae]
MIEEIKKYKYENKLSYSNRIMRLIWQLVSIVFFRFTPECCMHGWRLLLLRMFGATHGQGCRVSPSAHIWAPWNLKLGNFVCIAASVDCYNVDKIVLKDKVTVSQRSFLCTASHDIDSLQRPLIHAPITIEQHVWVCAEAFVGPGVTIFEGAVVAARAVVIKNVEAWAVVAGNPAKKIKHRNCVEMQT